MSTEREHRLRPLLARPTFATIDHDNPAPSCHCSGGSPRCRCWSRLSSSSLSLPRAYGPRPGIQCLLGPGSTRVCYTKTAERLVQDSEPAVASRFQNVAPGINHVLASLKISRGSDRLCVLQSSACATLPNLQAAVPHTIIMANDNTRKRRSKRHLGEPVALVSRVLHFWSRSLTKNSHAWQNLFDRCCVPHEHASASDRKIGGDSKDLTACQLSANQDPNAPQCAAQTSSSSPVQSERCGSTLELGSVAPFSSSRS